jgi:lysozyme family protein
MPTKKKTRPARKTRSAARRGAAAVSARVGAASAQDQTDRERFERLLKQFTFQWECVFDRQGRVIAEEDPDDPGGVTKYGIDKSGHPNLTADQIRNLTEDEAVEIYYAGEWASSHATDLAVPLGEIAFDMTVLDGGGRAMRALQGACGLTGADIDGAWGPTTRKAASDAAADPGRLLRSADRMLDWRAARYHNLVEDHPKLAKYLRGWLNRTNALREYLNVPDFA